MRSTVGALLLTLAVQAGALAGSPTPLPRAHAHNDYEHPRPLLDALDQGFASVEADVHLVDGRLLVAHDRSKVQPERTLEALYLDPLAERVRTNGGFVYDRATEFTLLVDIKADAAGSYAVLKQLLARHPALYTRFTDTNRTQGPITVILSGDRPREIVKSEPSRLCAIDGTLADLDAQPSPFLVPLISESWRPTFVWFRDEQIPEADRLKLRNLVTRAHQQGRRIRFWGVQDQPFVWRELRDAGVDLINTDRLADLKQFLTAPTNRHR
ncbi:MAG: phosphatidylinositol-specific phospholipase C/glycerophosphodiester phosphodiesterase family protein [Verrucomicrobiales bacterium]|nr:phosphatidylinositol-specific phospholipase C/glycerophosphodiester phosphodiesterase family protein [Verrucomicrobiales bacterium]